MIERSVVDIPTGVPKPTEHLTRPTILAMVAMGLAVLIIANDFTAFSVAIPSIEKDLHTDLAEALKGDRDSSNEPADSSPPV